MGKRVVCFGDSNTFGYCTNPDGIGYDRFDENTRWPCVLQKQLGPEYLVLEEGVIGRTTAFDDPLRDGMNGLASVASCVRNQEPVDLLIVMLGTNDVKERFHAGADRIAAGMEQLLLRAARTPGWRNGRANILVMSPPRISSEKSPEYHQKSSALAGLYAVLAMKYGWSFFDADQVGAFNRIDFMHLTQSSHIKIGEKLAEIVPDLLK